MWRHLTFGGRYIFYQQDISWDEEREKSHRGLYKENRVDVLENSHPIRSKMMSYLRPCDLGRCHVTKKYHRYQSSIDVFGRNWHVFFELFSWKTLHSLTCPGKKLMKKDCHEWRLTTVDPQKRSTWRSGVRSAIFACSYLSIFTSCSTLSPALCAVALSMQG